MGWGEGEGAKGLLDLQIVNVWVGCLAEKINTGNQWAVR